MDLGWFVSGDAFLFSNVGRGLYSCKRVFTMSSRGRYLRRASDSFSRMGLYLPWSSLSSSHMPAQLRGEFVVRACLFAGAGSCVAYRVRRLDHDTSTFPESRPRK